MMLQYIATLNSNSLGAVGYITTRRPLTHAVIGVFANSGKSSVLGWYENEFEAHAGAAEWRPFAGYSSVVVVPVTGYPVKELA